MDDSQPQLPSILLAAMALGFGGAETHVVHLARDLDRRGYPVTVASGGGPLETELAAAGVSHRDVPLDSRSPLALWRASRKLAQLLDTGSYDLLHAHARIPAWVGRRLSRARGLPMVTTYHGIYTAEWPLRALTRWGDEVIAVSEDVRQHLIHNFDADPRRLHVIPNGIDVDRFRPSVDADTVWSQCAGAESLFRIAHVSRLQDHFADAAAALIEALPLLQHPDQGVGLIIVGEGNRLEELRHAAEQANRRWPQPRMWVVGGQRRVEPFLAAADVVVAVARTALEAMACGRPVIIAGEGGLVGAAGPENADQLAAANFTGRQEGSPVAAKDLAEAVQPLIEDEARRKALGRFGRELVVSQYSMTRMVDSIITVYDSVLSGRGQRV